MNQQRILGELQGMLSNLEHQRRLNSGCPDDKMAQGAAWAYGSACRQLDRLIVKVLAEGVEIDESDIQTTDTGC
jgi:hypothetical protein